jgi:hypothetical protein
MRLNRIISRTGLRPGFHLPSGYLPIDAFIDEGSQKNTSNDDGDYTILFVLMVHKNEECCGNQHEAGDDY